MKTTTQKITATLFTVLLGLTCIAQTDQLNNYNGIFFDQGNDVSRTKPNTYIPAPARKSLITSPVAGFPCTPNTFYAITTALTVEELQISGNTVISNGTVAVDSGYRSMAFCNNLNGGAFSPTFYGSIMSTSGLDYFDGANWVPTNAGSTTGASGMGGYGAFLYLSYSDSIVRYDGITLSTLYRYGSGVRAYIADIAVDINGNAWTIAGPVPPLANFAASILVISPAGLLLHQYSIAMNLNNTYGCFLNNGKLYLAFGSANPIPNSLLPICFSGSTANIGSPISIGAQYTFDMASCDPGDPLTAICSGCALAVNLGSDTSLCNGDTLILDAGNPGATYVWLLDSVIITGATSQTYQAVINGNYSVIVTDTTLLCTATDTIHVEFGAVSGVSITSSQTVGCSDFTIYHGYGPQTITLTANTPGTVATYYWSTGDSTQSIVVDTAGTYSVTVWGSTGCSSQLGVQTQVNVSFIDVRCGNGLRKVMLCHVPPGNPSNAHTICVDEHAIPAHLANHAGDCIGMCDTIVPILFNHPKDEMNRVSVTQNPFTSTFSIQHEDESDDLVTVRIHDLTGKLVEEHTNISDHETIGSNLEEGIYFIEVISSQNTQLIKVIKLH